MRRNASQSTCFALTLMLCFLMAPGVNAQSRFTQQTPGNGVQTPSQPPKANPYPLTRFAERPQTPRPAPTQPQDAYVAPVESQPNTPAEKSVDIYEQTKIIARIGNHSILYGDVSAMVENVIKQNNVPEYQLEEVKKQLTKQALQNLIQNKVLYLAFERQVPPDRLPEIKDKVFKQFVEVNLPDMMKRAKVSSVAELEKKLRDAGSSQQKKRTAFLEQVLGREMVSQNIDHKPEITVDEMLAYYHEHAKDYEFAEQVRWEHLMVRFDRAEGGEAGAYRALAEMGNRVLRNAPFAKVAKKESHGFDAIDGGLHNWTVRGDLVSKPIEQVIFSLPENRLSEIFRDKDGFHIVRVIEHREAGKVDFVEAQVKIKTKLQQENVNRQIEKYVGGLMESTPVWTIFDEPQQTARPPKQNPSLR